MTPVDHLQKCLSRIDVERFPTESSASIPYLVYGLIDQTESRIPFKKEKVTSYFNCSLEDYFSQYINLRATLSLRRRSYVFLVYSFMVSPVLFLYHTGSFNFVVTGYPRFKSYILLSLDHLQYLYQWGDLGSLRSLSKIPRDSHRSCALISCKVGKLVAKGFLFNQLLPDCLNSSLFILRLFT